MDLKFNNWSELRFTVPYQIEGIKTAHYDDIQTLKMICIPKFEWKDKTLSPKNGLWFYIKDVRIKGDGIREVKECLAYTCEWELASKTINNVEGTLYFHNPLAPDKSLMHIIKKELPGWKIGDIPTGLSSESRTFDVKEQDIYSFLTNDVSELYECIFQFDTLNQVIHVMDVSKGTEFPKTNIFLSFDNLIKEVDIKSNVDNVITAMRVYGGNDLSIRGVNPNGTDTIYNINYFLNSNWMSAELIQALQTYNTKYETRQAAYTSAFSDLNKSENELIKLKANAPMYSVEFTMNTGNINSTTISWGTTDNVSAGQIIVTSNNGNITVSPSSAYNSVNKVLNLPPSGLSELQTLLNSLEGVRTTRISNGKIPYADVNFIIGSDGNDGADGSFQIQSGLKKIIINKNQAIATKEQDISNKEQAIREIVDDLKMENNFTEAQWIELNKYFRFSTFQDNSFIVNDNMTYDERLKVQQDLMDFASKELAKSSVERYTFEIKSINFPALKEFEEFTKQFELGTTITLSIRDNYVIKPLLLGIHLNFEDLTDFSLIYANSTSLDDNLFSISDMLSGANNMAKSVSFDAGKFHYMKQQSNEITDFMTHALNAAKNRIISSDKEEVTIDNHGIQLRQWDEDRLRYSGYETRIISNTIAMSNDGFNTASLALGLIPSPTGTGNVYGFIGSAIVGEIIAGNNLYISNDKNNFLLNETGAWLNNANFNITKGENTIILDPDEGFSIYKGDIKNLDNRQVYIGTDGNVYFIGKITGGSINIGGNFIVDDKGNTTIKAGSVEGYVTTGKFSELTFDLDEFSVALTDKNIQEVLKGEALDKDGNPVGGILKTQSEKTAQLGLTLDEFSVALTDKKIQEVLKGEALDEDGNPVGGTLRTFQSATLSLAVDKFTAELKDYSTTTEIASSIKDGVGKIRLSVENNESNTSSTLTLTAGKDEQGNIIKLGSANITLSGLVTFTALSENGGMGQTKIHGGNIEAETMSANVLNGGTINADTINVENLNWKNITKNRPSVQTTFELPTVLPYEMPIISINPNGTVIVANQPAYSAAVYSFNNKLSDIVNKYNAAISTMAAIITNLSNALSGSS